MLDEERVSTELGERVLVRLGATDEKKLAPEEARKVNGLIDADFQQHAGMPEWFRRATPATPATKLFRLVAALVAPALAVVSLWQGWPLPVTLFLVATTILFLRGLSGGVKEKSHSLGAQGTAYRQQAVGFRTYLRTAESRQLDFEADEDVYRRYLPWAVLFGETKRWTKVCTRLAAAGRIGEPDVSFVAGASSTRDVERRLKRVSSEFRRPSARRGTTSSRRKPPRRTSSGGRSGLSSRGGGSGSGGSRARSW